MARLRVVIWVVVGILVLALAVWAGQQPGRVTIDWFGYAVEMPAWLAASGMVVIFLLGAGLTRLLVYLSRDFPLSPAQRLQRRKARAGKKIQAALAALAGEEWATALRLAEDALALVEDPFAHWLAAEAASRLGEGDRAARHWMALEGDHAFQMLALRQRTEEARRKGDWEAVKALAGAAFATRPQSPWAARRLFEAFVHLGAFSEAEALLDKLGRLGLMDADTRRRTLAALATARALELMASDPDSWPQARQELERALKVAPDFAPAAAVLLRGLGTHGSEREARKRARRLLRNQAHPAVLKELGALLASHPPAERRRLLEEILADHAEEPEVRLLLAEAALAAGDRDAARTWLKGLHTEQPDRRVMLL
ncbi:MAG: hypothetical protein D6740_03000, partial [Alphaproteobacteria bacterium]